MLGAESGKRKAESGKPERAEGQVSCVDTTCGYDCLLLAPDAVQLLGRSCRL